MLNKSFLIDSNVFINSKNFYYHFDYCKMFWDFLLNLHKKEIIYSLESVKKELLKGNDLIVDWIKNEVPNTFFLPEFSSQAWSQNYSALMKWSQSNGFAQKARDDFANQSKADAFLIADAMTTGRSIITFEIFDSNNPKRRILIPNATKAHNVSTMTLFEFLPSYACDNFSCK
ncbi:hypothetical protein Xvie_03977 [Xenorhabdus vietnamensis]|uniref:Twitching motility protein PilT n=1 Tax=Xenorhabdus vietnamensis TaxID=351656 RepID=A0A1Y2S8V4_9GAMM|nr:DUF4411 family protein [Xenorhabdus vietnamensis]OTA14123.1 hypothetical protein Xvie_03977 [Xenorhabdus vietnamensis]